MENNTKTEAGKKIVLRLMEPYDFEGVEVSELDLSGLYSLTGRDLCQIDDMMIQRGYSGQNLELTKQYALLTAARVLKKPWEYCDSMKARDAIRLKNVVTNFFYTREFQESAEKK